MCFLSINIITADKAAIINAMIVIGKVTLLTSILVLVEFVMFVMNAPTGMFLKNDEIKSRKIKNINDK